jgi:small GTP-binding protein
MPSAESPQMRRCGTSTRLLAIAVVSSLLPSAAAFGAGGSALAGLQSLRPVRLGHASLGRAAAARTAGWSMEAAAAPTKKEMDSEIQRRRTFAIISHPDAGKTTLTEKLLLCGAPPQPRPGTKLCYGNGTYLPFDADTAIEQEFRGAQVRRRGAGGGYCEGQGRAAPRHLRLDVNRAGALLPTPTGPQQARRPRIPRLSRGLPRRAAKQRRDAGVQERGISISSTALQFEYQGCQINLLDTPGHEDFSEDTYRTIAAADNAVMLLDGAKGLEAQTLKLFDVVKLRKLPLFTFINKMDRPSLEPLELLDTIESTLGVAPTPVTWPIGSGDRFQGVYDRLEGKVILFEKEDKGARPAPPHPNAGGSRLGE